MDRKNLVIGMMSMSAIALLVANYYATPTVIAAEAVQGRDYQMVTANVQTGGQGLYVLDAKSGMLAVFTYDVGSRRMVPRAARPVVDAFAPATGGAEERGGSRR